MFLCKRVRCLVTWIPCASHLAFTAQKTKQSEGGWLGLKPRLAARNWCWDWGWCLRGGAVADAMMLAPSRASGLG